MHLNNLRMSAPSVQLADRRHLNRSLWLDITQPLIVLQRQCQDAGLDSNNTVVTDQIGCGETMLDEEATLDELHRFALQHRQAS